MYSNNSPSQRTNNPYSDVDDRNYEMSDVRSTTNLTAGLSGGVQEPMSDFYDEVTKRSSLSKSFTPSQHPTAPNHPPLSFNPGNSLTLILGFPARSRSPLFKTA